MEDGTALRTICGMEAKINSIQMLSRMAWVLNLAAPLDLPAIICLNHTDPICSSNSSSSSSSSALTKTSRTRSMAPHTAGGRLAAAAVGISPAVVTAVASWAPCRVIPPRPPLTSTQAFRIIRLHPRMCRRRTAPRPRRRVARARKRRRRSTIRWPRAAKRSVPRSSPTLPPLLPLL
ncbi:hypothetical protein VTN02DRAFT_1316 [Thermoascus thermophilus]